MFKKYFVHTPFVIAKFPLHKKIKKDLLNQIDKSKGSPFKNKKGHMNDYLEFPKNSEPTQFLAPQNLHQSFSLKHKRVIYLYFQALLFIGLHLWK